MESKFRLRYDIGTDTYVAIDAETGVDVGTVALPEEVRETLRQPVGACYTPEQVAALVEETQSKNYDYLKREVLNFLEAMLAAQGVTTNTKPMTHVVENILDGANRLEWDVIQRVTPDVTGAMVALAGEERRENERQDERLTSIAGLEHRIRNLRESLRRAENDLTQAKANEMTEKVYQALEGAPKEALPQVLDLLTRQKR